MKGSANIVLYMMNILRLLRTSSLIHRIRAKYLFNLNKRCAWYSRGESFDFHAISERSLSALQEQLESKESLLPASFDVEYAQGVLTVRIDPQTVYVLNKQPPNQQIWLSSPFSGPRRFEWSAADEKWRDVRDARIELVEFLGAEFRDKLKIKL